MSRYFNIGGPCNAADNYMLPAAERLPEVMKLIDKKQYFVIHAQRQCGKTTAFQALAREINTKGEMAALYCTVETVQEFTDPQIGLPMIAEVLRQWAVDSLAEFANYTYASLATEIGDVNPVSCVGNTIKFLTRKAGKNLVMFIDEVDCLSEGTLVSFLRQLRAGKIAAAGGTPFPISVALIGMRNIRDYRMRVRPESQSTGEASPFNVITEAMTLNLFTKEEVATLYSQHTSETGQVFEPEAIEKAYEFSRGQPYLVNALARWCVEKIHDEDFSQPITAADMLEAKEKLVRERGTHLDSLMEKAKDPRCRPIVEKVMLGEDLNRNDNAENIAYCLDLGLLIEENGVLKPANPIYSETIGRYLSYETQQSVRMHVQENPWLKDGHLDMPGLIAAFQQYWRENAGTMKSIYGFTEAVPHLVMQAFLQRVINGGGQIIREMALGKKALDLGVLYQEEKYAVEIKMKYNFDRSPEKAYAQVKGYADHLGVPEGWLVVFDPDMTKPWEEKISTAEVVQDGKAIHVIHC